MPNPPAPAYGVLKMSALRIPTVVLSGCNKFKGARQLSRTTQLLSGRNKPRNSGDKGPEKNYVKKMMKKANKIDNTEGAARTAFLNALKAIESGEHVPQDEQTQKAQENEL